MRVLSVRQPWAWAIVHGGKDVENRTRNVAGDYRGPVAIQASLREDEEAWSDPTFLAAWERSHALPGTPRPLSPMWMNQGSIIGVANLVDVHSSNDEWDVEGDRIVNRAVFVGCSPWAQGYGMTLQHLVFENPHPLDEPIAWKGALGLRALPEDVERDVLRSLS